MLLKAMLREEDTQQTWFGPLDQKDSTNSMLHFSDTLTWPEVLRIYLQSDPVYIPALELLESCEYPFTTCDVRLLVLKFLTDHFLCNTAVRQEILSEANIKYNDHCRVCYKVGDLLCCETCPAVFHLHCLNPPLEQVPSEDWQCPICTAQRCKGVTDCVSELEKSGLLCRQDCLGFDRHGRKYWFIARRIFVEENDGEDDNMDTEEIPVDKKVWYYSSPHQFEQLLAVLDEHEYERELCKELCNLRPEILRQMSMTIDLTNEFKGKNKTYLELDAESAKEIKRATPEAIDNDDEKELVDEKSEVDVKTESIKEEEGEEVVEESGVEVDDDFMQQLRVESEKAEEKQAADDLEKSKTGDESATYATRSKTGTIVSRNYVDPKRRTSTPNGSTAKEGEGKLTPLPIDVIYKLGMEGNYKQYVNQYSSNTTALNKVQAAEERDRKRYLSHKFALTGAGEFKWIGSTFGNKTAMLHTVRATLLQLHSQILATFMHPNWTLMRKPWIAAVNACVSPRDLGRALSVLAACIRPVVFNAVWHDSLGHIRLQRQTAFDREEKKKVDKKEKKEKELEEEMHRLHTVHYTKGLKHQIWKHKGEEFRLHGQWGWRWLSATRPVKRQDAQQSGMRAGPWKIMTLVQEDEGEERYVQAEPESGEAYDIPLDDPLMEVVDICAAMNDPKRRVYSKIAKKGKLDSLLDWRLKLKVTEAKVATATAAKKEEDDTEVDVEGEEEPKSRKLTSEQAAARLQALLGQSCYTSGCRKERSCYSPTCRAVSLLQQRVNHDKEESRKRAEAEEKLVVAINSTEAPVSLKRILNDDERNKKKRVPVKYPMMSAYMTKSKKRTIFVLPDHEIKHLSRRGGQAYVTGFHHGSKNNSTAWFYPSARPLFKTCWFFRTIGLQSLSAAALQLRILWACLRWDDMNSKAMGTADGKNQLTTDSEIVTTDILKHRHVGRFLERTQYFQRRVVIPLDVPKTVREVAPSRSGLRKRKLVEAPRFSQPVVSEEWIDEDRLDLPSIRHYHEKAERANTPIATRLKGTPQSGIKNSGVTMEELKEKAEQQLRAQRAAHQQKAGTPGNPSIVRLAVPVSGGKVAIPAAGGKNSIASLISSATGQGMAGRRILISKDGSPLAKTGQPTLIASAGAGAAASPAGTPNKIQITRGADGKIQIRGLQPGQQLIRLGDGRFSIVSTTTQPPATEQKAGDAATKTIILKSAASTPGAGAKPSGINSTQSLVQQITSGKVQLGSLNGQQVLVQSTNTPAATTPATPVAANATLKSETPTGTGQAATPKQALVLQSPQGPRIVVQNLQGGSLTPQQLSAIQEQLKNQLLRVVNKPGAQVVVRATTVPAAAATTTTGSATTAVNSTNAAVPISIAPSIAPSTPTSGTEKSNKFVVTPDFIQQTIRKALKQENLHPDIEQKLLQLQRFQDRQKRNDGVDEEQHQQQQTGGIRKRTVSNSSWQDKQDELESLPVAEAKTMMKPPARKIARVVVEPTVKPVAVTAAPTRTPTISNEEREQKARERSMKAQQRARERRMQQQQARLQGMMARNSELLKKDMLRKRALLEKELRGPIQRELSALRIPSPVRAPAVVTERLPVSVKEDVALSSPPRSAAATAPAPTPPAPAPAAPPTPRSQKKKIAAAEPKVSKVVVAAAAVEKKPVVTSPPPAKKQRVSSGGGAAGAAAAASRSANKKKLYCICRKPYDNSKFYVGCDLCSNWFHGDCVGITEDMSQSMSEFVCDGCSSARTTQELFCLCRQPYDDAQFYICCDRCQDWFHGRCVGVMQNESESIDEYTCPNCEPDVPFNYAIMRTLSTRDYEELRKLLRQLQTHKSSWPFRDPVSPRDVPDYYKIIKDPMDLRTIETKIQERRYQRLLEFIGDVTKIFENCRYYNAKESNIARCATSLESFFVPRLKILRNSMANS